MKLNSIVNNQNNTVAIDLENSAEFKGSNGDDMLQGYESHDTIYGRRGDDILKGDDGDDLILGGSGDDILQGDDGNDTLEGGHGDDILRGNEGNDILKGGQGDDILQGDYGNDTFFAGHGDDLIQDYEGNDTIFGGLGNDRITDYAGNDTYLFNYGDGQDAIVDKGGCDKVIFGAGLSTANINISENDSGDLILALKDNKGTLTGDRMLIEHAFSRDNHRIEKLMFSDGTSMNWHDIETIVHQKRKPAVTMNLNGTSGDDILQGDQEANIIVGGPGQDKLYGGYGNDNYVFNLGDGQDTIVDLGGLDQVVFGQGITEEHLTQLQKAKSTTIFIGGQESGDSVTLDFHQTSDSFSVEKLKLADGRELNVFDLQEEVTQDQLVQAMNSFEPDDDAATIDQGIVVTEQPQLLTAVGQ
tara:strand:+ start:2358 stop:3599 length:1242 start_codon:yes stop_codon:yes gene_type:complete